LGLAFANAYYVVDTTTPFYLFIFYIYFFLWIEDVNSELLASGAAQPLRARGTVV
jgi:hypothetical protein